MGTRRGISAALTAGVAALTLGGCVSFDGPIEGKQVSAKKVQVKFKVCQDGADCPQPKPPRRGDEATPVGLLGFRVPKGTDLPKSFQPVGEDLLFRRNRSYSTQLNRNAFTRKSERWVGYVSDQPEKSLPSEARFRLRFGLPDDPGAAFKYRPVVGYTFSTEQRPQKVSCNKDPFVEGNCVEDPETLPEVRKNLRIPLD